MKELYKKAKSKIRVRVKDHLQPPSPQGALASPAQSSRGSPEPTSAHDQAISATPSAIVHADQLKIAPTQSTTLGSDDRGHKEPSQASSPRSEDTPIYAQPPSSHSILAMTGSVLNDLVTVVHAASDVLPPLKSALGGILEAWKQYEVGHSPVYDGVTFVDYNFSELLRLKKSS